MFRHELSNFLKRVLDAIDRLPEGVLVDNFFEPDEKQVSEIATELGAKYDEVRQAIMGLEACSCFVQESLDIPGIEPVRSWRVHPQCRAPRPQGETPAPRRTTAKKPG